LRCLFFLNRFGWGHTLLLLNKIVLHLSCLATLGSSTRNLRLKRRLFFHCGCLSTLLRISLIVWIRVRIWITDNLQTLIFLRILLKLIFFLTLVLLTNILKRLHVFRVFVFACTFHSCLLDSISSYFILSVTRAFWCILSISRLLMIYLPRTFHSLGSCWVLLHSSETWYVTLTIRLHIYRSWSYILSSKTTRVQIRNDLVHVDTIMADA
jgi:hypothetical protein